jgi:3-oxo-5-alpha-steroid 4-dehydrogenase 1
MALTTEREFYWVLTLAWVVVAAGIVPYLLLRPAPYGRHSRPGWGATLNARLAWLLMEAPSPLGMLALFFLGRAWVRPTAVLLLGMWLGHYLYRAFVYPWLLPSSARPMPVAVMASGAFFNVVNAYLNGRWLFALGPVQALDWIFAWRFALGGALFLVGLATHILADRELRALRRASNGQRGLPTGWLFRRVSCPNYLGELVEWMGFAVATWSPGALVFAWWSAANLVPRAIHHHRWYRAQFPDYPSARRAVIPGLL